MKEKLIAQKIHVAQNFISLLILSQKSAFRNHKLKYSAHYYD